MQQFKSSGADIHYSLTGGSGPLFIWAHGWGQSHEAFKALAGSFTQSGRHLMVDFPGFGSSPPPPNVWGTEDYADAMAGLIETLGGGPVIWIGHSFGCRVGIQMGARHPALIRGLFLIAGAGLKRKRPLHKRIYLKARVMVFKTLKKIIPPGAHHEWLIKTFSKGDYRNAGAMRGVFVKVVNENLSAQAARITCPVQLVYGANDTETPPEIGRRLNALIKNSAMVELPGQDHYSVLAEGRHQVAPIFKKFIESQGGQ